MRLHERSIRARAPTLRPKINSSPVGDTNGRIARGRRHLHAATLAQTDIISSINSPQGIGSVGVVGAAVGVARSSRLTSGRASRRPRWCCVGARARAFSPPVGMFSSTLGGKNIGAEIHQSPGRRARLSLEIKRTQLINLAAKLAAKWAPTATWREWAPTGRYWHSRPGRRARKRAHTYGARAAPSPGARAAARAPADGCARLPVGRLRGPRESFESFGERQNWTRRASESQRTGAADRAPDWGGGAAADEFALVGSAPVELHLRAQPVVRPASRRTGGRTDRPSAIMVMIRPLAATKTID